MFHSSGNLKILQSHRNIITSSQKPKMGSSPPSKQAKARARTSGQTRIRIKKTCRATSKPHKSKREAIQKAVTKPTSSTTSQAALATSNPPSSKAAPKKEEENALDRGKALALEVLLRASSREAANPVRGQASRAGGKVLLCAGHIMVCEFSVRC